MHTPPDVLSYIVCVLVFAVVILDTILSIMRWGATSVAL